MFSEILEKKELLCIFVHIHLYCYGQEASKHLMAYSSQIEGIKTFDTIAGRIKSVCVLNR